MGFLSLPECFACLIVGSFACFTKHDQMVTPNQLSSVCSRSGCTRFDLQAVLGMPTNLIILNLMTNYRPLITSAATVQRKGVFVVGVVWVWCDTMRFDERGVGGFADRQHTGL